MCSARLTSPLTVAMICMILAEEQLRKDEGVYVQEQFVYPPLKKIRMHYGKTSKQKWLEFLEKQTYSKIQNTGGIKQHTPTTRKHLRSITLILEMKPVLIKEEVARLWRDKEKEWKRSQHYKGL